MQMKKNNQRIKLTNAIIKIVSAIKLMTKKIPTNHIIVAQKRIVIAKNQLAIAKRIVNAEIMEKTVIVRIVKKVVKRILLRSAIANWIKPKITKISKTTIAQTRIKILLLNSYCPSFLL